MAAERETRKPTNNISCVIRCCSLRGLQGSLGRSLALMKVRIYLRMSRAWIRPWLTIGEACFKIHGIASSGHTPKLDKSLPRICQSSPLKAGERLGLRAQQKIRCHVSIRRVDLYPSRFQARVMRWVRVLFEGLGEIVTKDELKNSTHPNIVSPLLPEPAIHSATDAKVTIMRMNATSTRILEVPVLLMTVPTNKATRSGRAIEDSKASSASYSTM